MEWPHGQGDQYEFTKKIKHHGFVGINNSRYDGMFRQQS